MDITETVAPKSDQLDNLELRGGHHIFTVTAVDVHLGSDQPVHVHLAEFPRPWKPGKNMRRVLKHCWGKESDDWIGRRVELFSDEKVKFGNETPGGTRISRISHVDGPQAVAIMVSQGRADFYKVGALPDLTPTEQIAALRAEWQGADPERRKVIESQVAALQPDASPYDKPAARDVEDTALPGEFDASVQPGFGERGE